MRVYLETIRTVNRRGNPGVRQRWVAEVKPPRAPLGRGGSIGFAELVGYGRTRLDAIADLHPRPWDMDFDATAWKVRYVFGEMPVYHPMKMCGPVTV